MEGTDITIDDLPDEMIEVFQFLSEGDLNACYSVCERWRWILKQSSIWKKYCIYPEKYLIKKPTLNLEFDLSAKGHPWRKHYEQEQSVCKNFSEGRFVVEKTGFSRPECCYECWFVDDHGNHWLVLECGLCNLEIWNITNVPILHCEYKLTISGTYYVYYVKGKLVIVHLGFAEVFQFVYPDYNFTLRYRFVFDSNAVLPTDEFVSEKYWCRAWLSHIIVDEYLVGCSEFFKNLNTAFLHIWNLGTGQKVATQSTFQQSLVDFLGSQWIGRDITGARTEMSLFGGNCGRFLVKITINQKSQISMFSLNAMKFVSVIAQLLHTQWECCHIKGDMVVMQYIFQNSELHIAIYSVSGQLLSFLNMGNFNAFPRRMMLYGSKIIVKSNKRIQVINVVNSKLVCKNSFDFEETDFIRCYFEPRFLAVCMRCRSEVKESNSYGSISFWDIDLGVKLWEVKNVKRYCFSLSKEDAHYPGKLIFQLSDDPEVIILNFEKEA